MFILCILVRLINYVRMYIMRRRNSNNREIEITYGNTQSDKFHCRMFVLDLLQMRAMLSRRNKQLPKCSSIRDFKFFQPFQPFPPFPLSFSSHDGKVRSKNEWLGRLEYILTRESSQTGIASILFLLLVNGFVLKS